MIYVGKAKSLRAALSSYFQDPAHLHERTARMVKTAASVEWTVVETEVEALQLEYSWIKEFDPRFNVKYRDDKSYPWLAVTLNEEFPAGDGGPGAEAQGRALLRAVLARVGHPRDGRPAAPGVPDAILLGRCLQAQRSDRPALPARLHRQVLGALRRPGHGRGAPRDRRRLLLVHRRRRPAVHVQRLERTRCAEASDRLEFELAARLRDDIGALKRAMEKNAVVLPDGTDADVIAVAEDPLEIAVQMFYVRGGTDARRAWVGRRPGRRRRAARAAAPLPHPGVRRRERRRDPARGAASLSDRTTTTRSPPCSARGAAARVEIRVPQRGDKRSLMETVARNAGQALALHKTRRASDLTTRSRALEEIQQALGLAEAPLADRVLRRLEPAGHRGGRVDGRVRGRAAAQERLPAVRDQRGRRPERRGGHARDDHPTVQAAARRPGRVVAARPRRARRRRDAPALIDPDTGRPRKFAYAPGLVVVDGGPPQVAAAQRALDELGIDDIPVVGLAKRLEEVWRPGQDDPVIMARTSEGLYLLQRMRDEAHRFAITHHRSRRSKSMVESVLDDVPGLGEVRRKVLLRHFGSLKKLRAATLDEIAALARVRAANR